MGQIRSATGVEKQSFVSLQSTRTFQYREQELLDTDTYFSLPVY